MKHWALGILVGGSLACTTQAPVVPLPQQSAQAPAQLLAQLATIAEFGASRGERLAAAKAGMQRAQQCRAAQPNDPACHYYHAVHTGLYYQIHLLGYQRGLTQMLADCERVNQLEPTYADAGCYRMIGQIFTQLPQTAFRPEHLVRDLDRAATALQTAVRLAPRSFENQLALCETTLALGNRAAAQAPCATAARLLPAQRTAPGYENWRRAIDSAHTQLK